MQIADIATYLEKEFNSKGNNSSLAQCVRSKACASFSEIISLVKTIINQHHLYISLVMLVFKSVVQNKVLYECQSWSNLSTTDINCLSISYNNEFKQILSAPT